jgi:hypothetical protein
MAATAARKQPVITGERQAEFLATVPKALELLGGHLRDLQIEGDDDETEQSMRSTSSGARQSSYLGSFLGRSLGGSLGLEFLLACLHKNESLASDQRAN